ncbi:MAG: DUF3467 domain-containing protein [Desulfobacterales bacterium]
MEGNAKNEHVKVVWDDADVRSVYPDIAQVKASRSEVMLFFGRISESRSQPNERRADLIERVVLNPYRAKLLAAQLNRSIRDFDAARVYTTIEPTPPMDPPPFESDNGRRTVDMVFGFLKEKNIQAAFEHSFKMTEDKLLDKRFLLGFDKRTIRENPDLELVTLCRQIGMPEDFLTAYQEKLPASHIVGFGFGEGEGVFAVKAYLEFEQRFFRAFHSRGGRADPYVSHLGFKWDAADHAKKVLTRYTCHPGTASGEAIKRLSNYFDNEKEAGPFESVRKILETASRAPGGKRFQFLEVTEEGSQRSSFDINLYGAGLNLGDINRLLLDIARHFSLPHEPFQRLCETHKDHVLGHLAGGRDRNGKDFVTVYSGE